MFIKTIRRHNKIGRQHSKHRGDNTQNKINSTWKSERQDNSKTYRKFERNVERSEQMDRTVEAEKITSEAAQEEINKWSDDAEDEMEGADKK